MRGRLGVVAVVLVIAATPVTPAISQQVSISSEIGRAIQDCVQYAVTNAAFEKFNGPRGSEITLFCTGRSASELFKALQVFGRVENEEAADLDGYQGTRIRFGQSNCRFVTMQNRDPLPKPAFFCKLPLNVGPDVSSGF